eukprot:UN25092
MGGGKGGADFNPKGKTNGEIMRFCQSFMTELHKYIGPTRDVPAGDIGVGGREIGYMFGQYKRLTSNFGGVLTGKGYSWGGSKIRPEATGYGVVYFAKNALEGLKDKLEGKRCVVSGSGNVASYLAQKLLHEKAVPITFSDSSGYIYCETGFTQKHIDELIELKKNRSNRVSEMVKKYPCIKFVKGKKVWEIKCDIAFPAATQNELQVGDAETLVKNGCKHVFEGANMP